MKKEYAKYIKRFSVQELIFLYKKDRNNRTELFNELKERYFNGESKYSFDLYGLIYDFQWCDVRCVSAMSLKDIETFNHYTTLLYHDLMNVDDICDKYMSSFFKVLSQFIIIYSDNTNDSEELGVIKTLNNIPKLIEILQNIKKYKVKNDEQIAQINNIINIVNVENKKRIIQERAEKTENKIVEEDNEEIKNLKIIKSKLNKEEMKRLFNKIELFNEQEQNDLIEYGCNKWSSDIINSLPVKFLLTYLIKHPCNIDQTPLDIMTKHYLNPNIIGFKSQEELCEAIMAHYLTMKGTSYLGWEIYSALVLKNKEHEFFLKILTYAVDKLKQGLTENSFQQWHEKINVPRYYFSGTTQFISNHYDLKLNRYVANEPDFEILSNISRIDLFSFIFETLKTNNIMKNDNIAFGLNDCSFDTDIDMFKNVLKDIRNILNSMNVTQKDFDYISLQKGQLMYFDTSNFKDNFKKYLTLFLSNNKISKETAELFFEKDNMVLLNDMLTKCSYNLYGNQYSEIYDFLIEAYLIGLDKLSFKNEEHLKIACLPFISNNDLTKKIVISNRYSYSFSLYDILMKKLMNENPDLYNFVKNLMDCNVFNKYEFLGKKFY